MRVLVPIRVVILHQCGHQLTPDPHGEFDKKPIIGNRWCDEALMHSGSNNSKQFDWQYMTYNKITPIVVFHPGKQHSPQTALALQQAGRLRYYATSIFYDPRKFPYYLEKIPGAVGRKLHSEFSRFEHPGINADLVRTWGTLEWFERFALRVGASKLSQRIDRIGNERFAQGLERDINSDVEFALWGYNGASLGAFRKAKARGRTCILDRTIGDYRYYNKIMAEQEELYPQFFNDGTAKVTDDSIALDDEEYELADKIVVGSEFCRQTIINFSQITGIEQKIHVLPYCSNNHDFGPRKLVEPLSKSGPLKFLFVGRITPRKGAHLMLEAISKFDPEVATLTLLGKMLIPNAAYKPYAKHVRHLQSVAPSDVANIMAQHHVLILPSFFEGSAITLLEALTSGMGIIQSQQAGNGATEQTGLLLRKNTVADLYEAMQVAVNNRKLVETWRNNSKSEANHYSFEKYRQNITAFVSDI